MRRLLLIALCLFCLLAPVSAQAVDPLTLPDSQNVTLNIWQVLGGLIAAVSAGGVMGFAGAGVIASRLRNDAATMAAIEALAKSAPPDVIKLMAVLGKSSIEVGKLLEEASDGIPVSTKTIH